MASGVISPQVAALIDGVLKTMLMTKLKIATAVLLVVSLVAIPASGLAYWAIAGEGPEKKQRQEVRPDAVAKDPGAEEKELRQLAAKVDRLQAENAELKKRMQKQANRPKAGDAKLVIKVYAVTGLTTEVEEDATEARSLRRVISNTIEPTSWGEQGGDGAMEYLPAADCLVIRQSPEI